jgi:hypothetical protein
MLPAAVRCVLVAVLTVILAAAAHAAGKATVRGAEAVNVREEPRPDSPAFVTLRKGREVTVEKVIGDWALITLDSGRQGYVRAVFLNLPRGIESVAGQTPEAAQPAQLATHTAIAATETPAGAATSAAAHAADSRDGLEREVAQLRDRLAALESAVVATPAEPGSHAGGEAPLAERPGEGEPTRAAGALLPTVSEPPEQQEIGPSLALAGVGLLVGFLIGAAYGQRQERNRRSRVRF